jgi:hypothetical protein
MRRGRALAFYIRAVNDVSGADLFLSATIASTSAGENEAKRSITRGVAKDE